MSESPKKRRKKAEHNINEFDAVKFLEGFKKYQDRFNNPNPKESCGDCIYFSHHYEGFGTCMLHLRHTGRKESCPYWRSKNDE